MFICILPLSLAYLATFCICFCISNLYFTLHILGFLPFFPFTLYQEGLFFVSVFLFLLFFISVKYCSPSLFWNPEGTVIKSKTFQLRTFQMALHVLTWNSPIEMCIITWETYKNAHYHALLTRDFWDNRSEIRPEDLYFIKFLEEWHGSSHFNNYSSQYVYREGLHVGEVFLFLFYKWMETN